MPDAMPPTDLHSLDRAHVFHPSTHMRQHAAGETPNRIITGGKGVYIWDDTGKKTLDAFAGLYCVNVGYGRQEIADAIHKQASELAYYHTYVGHGNEPVIRLSQRIIEKAPQGLCRIYYGMSGSDANETQIKLVWYYNNILGRPEKKKIISRWRGYHGSGVMTGSLTGLEAFHKAFDLPRAPILHTTAPYQYWNGTPGESSRDFAKRCAADLDALIQREGPETVAAFIGEPVLGTGGIVPPPEGYWDEIQKVLRKHDVLLIADEVVTAFGRTGQYFGSDTYGITPDLMTIAKGVSSGYLPLSGVIVSEKVWQVLEDGSDQMGPIGHGWTYSAHPVCAAAANANLDIVDGEDLTGNARDTGAYLQQRLHETFDGHPLVGEVRGVGLMAALEFVADREKKQRFDPAQKVGPRVSAACLANGMMARAMPHGDILGFAPPLVITRDEVDTVVATAKTAVDQVAAELARE
ncbi:aspartate aminotransferase family protein [Caenispirillum bisanense]|uniref:L-2,4-diaminobutyrate transaminase n=1 Tax=Caenispirillum bisanense TaxID=414052 RepID=A0A286G6M1_9PROT|nr:aspartate aminotransferase family protein [Caenispirillum bisanense]SOD91210.1 L-2,4-diaminobutyrate transaminase [Caenispirillum bisanense]